ncbi:MAG: DUF4249 family protein [Saprospiraceae bacterium]|nr:DUF4249 family protein [Saprospiraceae bacterium]
MKKIQTTSLYAVFACFFCLFNISCNNDLDLVEGGKEVPIVYGFLSLNDTATYIRIEHSFVDENKPAGELALIADSLYYANINVTLVRVSNNEKFNLTRVNGTTEGYPRDKGTFAQSPNYLYKAKNSTLSMRADEQWRIVVQKTGDTKVLAQATTKVVGDYNIFAPQAGTSLFLTYDNTFNISVESSELTAKFYDVKVIVNYDETIGSTMTAKKAEWLLASGSPRRATDAQSFFRRNAKDFYVFLANAIPVNTNATRKFKDFDIEVTAGGQELIDFVNVGISNIGITGSQAIPTYTNIENGLGIFTSRSKAVLKGMKLNQQSLDLLTNGDLTKNLNFR